MLIFEKISRKTQKVKNTFKKKVNFTENVYYTFTITVLLAKHRDCTYFKQYISIEQNLISTFFHISMGFRKCRKVSNKLKNYF